MTRKGGQRAGTAGVLACLRWMHVPGWEATWRGRLRSHKVTYPISSRSGL